MHAELLSAGKADQFRVLYGRMCECLSMPEIAECLQLPLSTVENYFKRNRQRLADQLQSAARQQVARYCPAEEIDAEFQLEWRRLSNYLAQHDGLEGILRRAFAGQPGLRLRPRRSATLLSVLHELQHSHEDPKPTSS